MKWEKVYLRELVKIKNGKDHKALKDGIYPVYGSGGIMRYAEKYIYDKESVLLPRKGTLNNIQFVNKPFWTVDTCYYTEVNTEKVIPYFLYQSLKQFDIEALNTGSAVPSMTFERYYSIEIPLPPLPIQKKIAFVLSCYDDLIENCRKQIALLEEAAARLYRKWFVEKGEEEGWERKPLSEITSIVTGKKDANFGTKDGKYLFFTCGQEPIKAPSYSFDCNAVILAGNGDFNVKLYRGKFEAYQRTYVFSPYKAEHLYLLYFAIKENMRQLFQGASGSTIKFLTKPMLEKITVCIPEKDTLNKFTNCCEAYQSKIETLQRQISLLATARDLCLPRLMSGRGSDRE